MKLQGIFIDTATPFDHAGNLYRVKIEHNIAKWNQTSVAGYVVGGFTGEGPLLSSEEKDELWKAAADYAGKDKVLIAGVDAAGVHEASAQVNRAAGHGFAAALVETPHYDTEVQLLYFRSIADRSTIPILVSNRIAALLQHPNIHGVENHSGVEAQLWNTLHQGASGVVLAFANAAPYAAIAVWEAFRSREEEAGLDWQSRIAPAAGISIAGLKYAMDLNGYYGGPPRLPRSTAGPAERIEIERAFKDLKS